jgi:hypothetical protein
MQFSFWRPADQEGKLLPEKVGRRAGTDIFGLSPGEDAVAITELLQICRRIVEDCF